MRANVPSESCLRAGESRPRRPERLVIGYGNDLRSDDGAGVRVAARLAGPSTRVRVIVAHQLTPELADDVAAATQVIFVDAYAARAEGAALRIEKISGEAVDRASALAHRVNPARLVGLAGQLFGAAPEAWVVGIPAFCLDLGETLSSGTELRVEEAVALIGKNEFRETQGGSPE